MEGNISIVRCVVLFVTSHSAAIGKELNANFDFDVTVANDIAKCALPGKVMQGSPCLEVQTLTNENGCFIMKLNYFGAPVQSRGRFLFSTVLVCLLSTLNFPITFEP